MLNALLAPRARTLSLGCVLPHACVLPGAVAGAASAPPCLAEVRLDSLFPATDVEFIELAGPAGLPLDGYALVVLGDADEDESGLALGDSGVVESVIHLDGLAIPDDRALLIHSSGLLLVPPDAVATLALEDLDNLTVLLVAGATCVPGDDLDLDDDGTLDVPGWKSIVDGVSFVQATEGALSEWTYAPTRVESDGGWFVLAARRCLDTGAWLAEGPALDLDGADTPGAPNAPCAGWLCTADITSDGRVDAADLAVLLGDWGGFGTMSDLDGDWAVDAEDLTILLSHWGACDL